MGAKRTHEDDEEDIWSGGRKKCVVNIANFVNIKKSSLLTSGTNSRVILNIVLHCVYLSKAIYAILFYKVNLVNIGVNGLRFNTSEAKIAILSTVDVCY